MEKVIVFLDYANLDASARENGCDIDCAALLDYLAASEEGRFLGGAFAYVPIDPRQEHAQDVVIDNLWNAGYLVKSKVGTIASSSYKCDFDVEITLDIVRAAYDMRPDIVVLISGDSDFVPVVLNLREKGIRVEVAAFNSVMSRLLGKRCSGFICLDALVNTDDMEENPLAEGTADNPANNPVEDTADNSSEALTDFEQEFYADYDTSVFEDQPTEQETANLPSAEGDSVPWDSLHEASETDR